MTDPAEDKHALLAHVRAVQQAELARGSKPANTAAPAAPVRGGARAPAATPRPRERSRAKPKPAQTKPAISRGDDARTWIHETPDESRVTDETVDALAKNAATLFRMAPDLVEVIDGQLHTATAPRVRDLASSVAVYFHETTTEQGEIVEKPVHPPRYVADAILARPTLPMRPLAGIARQPILRPDGSLWEREGYDDVSRLFYAPATSFPALPSSPSKDHARAAFERLAELFADFPYDVRELGASVAIAAILTFLARHLIDHAPVKTTSGSGPGCGKGLEADVITTIGMGETLPRSPWPSDSEEQRKLLDGFALRKARGVLLDNIVVPLGGPDLERTITSTTVDVRILGRSETVTCEQRATFMAEGNNIRFAGDMPRRCYQARLVPPDDRPDQRSGFRFPRLLEHVQADRPRYVVDALTILVAHARAGRPAPDRSGGWGSFERWTSVVADAVVFADGRDPLEARVVRDAKTDTVGEALEGLVRLWNAFGGTGGVELATSQFIAHVSGDAEASAFLEELLDALVPSRHEKQTKAARLSTLLSRHAERWVAVDFGTGKPALLGFVKGSKGMHGVRWKLTGPRAGA